MLCSRFLAFLQNLDYELGMWLPLFSIGKRQNTERLNSMPEVISKQVLEPWWQLDSLTSEPTALGTELQGSGLSVDKC